MFVVIGTTTADLFISGVENMPRFDGDEFTSSSLAFCRRPLTMTLGGNGANSAYVLRTLGAPVALCSATGTNVIGDTVTGWLADRGVDLRGFLRREGSTATTTTVLDDRLNRISFYYPGLFPTFNEADLPGDIWNQAHTLLITGYRLLPGFRGEGFAATLRTAREHRLRTALDIGPAIGAPLTLDELAPLLPLVDYLFANAYELTVATGAEAVEASTARMRAAGARCVVAKLGRAGAFVRAAGQAFHVEGFPIQASVTIGAGDSFNAGFLYALHEGQSLTEAAAFANATAALVVQGGQSALGAPTAGAVRAFLEKAKHR